MNDTPPRLRSVSRYCLARLDVSGPPIVCELEMHDEQDLHQSGPVQWGSRHSTKKRGA